MIEGTERRLRPIAHRNNDLLVGHRRHVACREHARNRGLPTCIDFDLTTRRQRQGSFEPLTVRQQSDLDKDAFQRNLMRLIVATIFVLFAGRTVLMVGESLVSARATPERERSARS